MEQKLCETDVVIIGGGPAGCTAAALLARNGWNVTLLEREAHPRFHIGESLLPMNLPIFDELGVLEKVAELGIKKNAAQFTNPSIKAKPTRFPFANALGNSPPHAYQIERSKLDQLLFENATQAGADTRENHKVTKVEFGTEAHTVFYTVNDSGEQELKCRYVLDASGQQTLVARQHKWR